MEHYGEGIMFDNLYIPYDHEISAFGKNWIGPNKYPIWDWLAYEPIFYFANVADNARIMENCQSHKAVGLFG